MEERGSPTRTQAPAPERFAESLQAARVRAREVLDGQRERLERMEAELAAHLQTIADELRRDREDVERRQSDIGDQVEALDRRRAAFLADQRQWKDAQDETFHRQQSLADELKQQRGALERRAEELAAREQKLQEDEAALREARRSCDAARREMEDEAAELTRAKSRLEEKRQALDEARDRLDREARDAKSQRRRVAHVVKEQREAIRRERAELAEAVEARRREAEVGRDDAERYRQLEQKFELALNDAREQKRRNAELEEELAHRPTDQGASAAELAKLREENETLRGRLAAAEAKAKTPLAESELQRKAQDLQRRFEMAVEDLREVKLENTALKEELAEAKQHAARQASASLGGGQDEPLDWEAQKQRLLAALEEDFDEDDEQNRQDRLTVEGAIYITDEVVADKEREIAELKQLLDQQSSNLGGVAVGAAAIEAALDQDELIGEERERIARLKGEWEEKLRQAEIDISLERAQLARWKAELESRAHALETEQAQLDRGGEDGQGEKSSGRGRWLARLGLKDADEEKK